MQYNFLKDLPLLDAYMLAYVNEIAGSSKLR